MIRARGLTVTLDGRALVANASFDLDRHGRLLVTADRGDALTAFSYALAGLLPSPWRRAVEASEWSRDWAQFEQRILAADLSYEELALPERVALVPEDLDTWFLAGSGYDELTFFGWSEGRDARADAMVFALVDRDLLSRPIYSLSGGEKQRLALAESVVAAPDCLVLLNSLGWLDRQHRPIALEVLDQIEGAIIFCDDHLQLLRNACTQCLDLGSPRPRTEPQTLAEAARNRSTSAPGRADPPGARGGPGPSPGPLIVATGLSFGYTGFDEVSILHEAAFDVPSVRDVFLVGPNGTGKSTLATLACGLEKGYRGSLRVWDERIGLASPAEARKRLGPSAPQILFQFVDDNLIRPTAGAYLGLGVDAAHLEARGDVVGSLADAQIPLDGLVTELDAFQKKLLVLGRMAITDCRLAFLDEPSWGLTRPEQARLYRFVDRFLPATTRIWITHEPESVPYAPEATIELRNGKVRVKGALAAAGAAS